MEQNQEIRCPKCELEIQGEVVRVLSEWPNYGISRKGNVYRLSTKRMMTPVVTNAGYYVVRTCHNNIARNVFIHVMLAKAWIENDDPVFKTEVNHIDGDKANYSIENLEWVTISQNQRHAIDKGLKSIGEDLYNAELTNDQVHLVCQRIQDGLRIADIASLFDVSKDIIRKIKSGDSYPSIRKLYNIEHDYRIDLSEQTVRWVCERINEGLGDVPITKLSSNKSLNVYDVRRIRNKIRYRTISDEYF